MSASKGDELLLERFVASFDKLDGMLAIEDLDPIAWELSPGVRDEHGWKYWRPTKVCTERSALDSVYSELPAQFPPLYELLVLSYRWAEVDLGLFTLLPNPLGPDLSGLLVRDQILTDFLLPLGYIQFGKGPDADYDPVCFDISSRKKNGDYGIVKIDHEEILCNDRLKVVADLAPNFEELVKAVIETAEHHPRTV
jgi:hypothetical protein